MVSVLIVWSTLFVWVYTVLAYAYDGDWFSAGFSLIILAICVNNHGLLDFKPHTEYYETKTYIIEDTVVSIYVNYWYAVVIVATWCTIILELVRFLT